MKREQPKDWLLLLKFMGNCGGRGIYKKRMRDVKSGGSKPPPYNIVVTTVRRNV